MIETVDTSEKFAVYFPGTDHVVLPHIVYYKNDHSCTPVCTPELSAIFNCTYSLPTTLQQLTRELENSPKFLLINAYDFEESDWSIHEFLNMIDSLIKFMPTPKNINIGVVINSETSLKFVKEIQKTKVLGIILNIDDFSHNDVIESVQYFLLEKPYWPKHVISALPGNIKKILHDHLHLTARQKEVMLLICNRGISNKQIAKMLNISESTVKIHVSAILKAYAVRNRTQLALAAGPHSKY